MSWLGLLAVSVGVAAVVGAGVVLSAVSEDVLRGDGLEVRDPSNLQWFADHRSGLLVSVARGLSQLGSVGVLVVVAIAAAIVLWVRGARVVTAVAPLAALVVAGACAGFGKFALARQRPPAPLRLVNESDASFPSGHSTDSAALFVALGLVVAVVLLRRPIARVATVAAAGLVAGLIGLSRLELGVHWPTDVLAGWALGFGVAVTVCTVALFVDHVASTGGDATDANQGRVVVWVRRLLTFDRWSLRAVGA